MDLFVLKILIGFTVGLLIGLTGWAAASCCCPCLHLRLSDVPALSLAVGSDALFNFFTKIPASIMHFAVERHSAEKK